MVNEHENIFAHRDSLEELNQPTTLRDKLVSTHQSLKARLPFVARVAVALYDAETKVLKTYLHSSGDDSPLEHYQALLDDAPALKTILDSGRPRVVNDMLAFSHGEHEHTQKLGQHGYAASYTLPLYNNGDFIGFVFFNSYERAVFTEDVLSILDLYGHLVGSVVIGELSSVNTLTAAVKTTGHITHLRDPETGCHLERMSRYSRIIATALADQYDLDDDYIEHVFMFSPLHDIGKIGIPDGILLKPGPLDQAEAMVMKTHARTGSEMIDALVRNFGLNNFQHIDMLRNIAEYHHEAVNGSGYPEGRARDEIPLEARIVAVADIFDALTSKRPYKEAWSNAQAIDMLKKLVNKKLDQDCVGALLENMAQVEEIQRRFKQECPD